MTFNRNYVNFSGHLISLKLAPVVLQFLLVASSILNFGHTKTIDILVNLDGEFT